MSGRRFIDKDKLVNLRIRARLSQAELARRAGLHPTYIHLLEKGDRRGSPESLGRIADVLICDIAKLMPDEEKPEKPGPARRKAAENGSEHQDSPAQAGSRAVA